MPWATAASAGEARAVAGGGGLAPAGRRGEEARGEEERDAAAHPSEGAGAQGRRGRQGGIHHRGKTIDVAPAEDGQHRPRGVGDEDGGQHEPGAAGAPRQRLELLVGGIVDEEVREGQPRRPREGAGGGELLLLRDLDGDAGGGQTGGRAFLDEPLHGGHLGAAGRAPGRPQRDEVHAAGQGHRLRALALERREREPGKGDGRQGAAEPGAPKMSVAGL